MPTNTSDSLDLYAKVEDLLGIEGAIPRLYAHYLLFLRSVQPKTLLDVGCGSGDFLVQMKKALKLEEAKGIDLSPLMVERTQSKGIDAACIDLCDLEGRYDVITAVFDMVNYLDAGSLQRFLGCIADHLNEDGYFLFDVNTLYGFENVAVGAFIVDDEDRFLAIDSDFEKRTYEMELTLFEKKGSAFVKSKERITQHYHTLATLTSHTGLKLVSSDEVELYEMGEADKLFVVLQKS
ncbi:MAG: class I SAM-dependent methyltransferase [Sulfurovum sp.]|nr:class I SAM-dependent methyltransferase [Sulfurovum sp.]